MELMARRRHGRRWGLLAGFGLAAATVVTAGIIVATSTTTSERPLFAEEVDGIADPGFPDVRSGLRGGEGLFLQFVDRDDPTRVAGELRADSFDPVGPRRFEAVSPIVWIFQDDGTTIQAKARRGSFFTPGDQQEPESGTLEGDVEIRVFDPVAGDRPEIGVDEPRFTLTSPLIAFDTALGEATTDQSFVLTGDEVQAGGQELVVRVDEVNERLAWLQIAGGDQYLRVRGRAAAEAAGGSETNAKPERPASKPSGTGGGRSTKPSPGGSGAKRDGPPAAPTAAPDIALYVATFDGDVVVTRGDQVVESDHLRLWARLVDGSLRDGAIAEPAEEESGPTAERPPTPPEVEATGARAGVTSWPLAMMAPVRALRAGGPTGEAEPIASEPEVESDVAGDEREWVDIRWTDKLVVRPMATESEELAEDDVAVRFWSEEGRDVQFHDAKMRGTGHCAELRYWATRGRGSLKGSDATGSCGVSLEETGGASFARCEFDWVNGLAHLDGAGEAWGEGGQRIAWSGWADLVFRVAGGRMASDLEQARFNEDVLATRDTAWLEGESMQVDFSVDADGSFPSHVRVERSDEDVARAARSPREFLEGDVIDAELRRGPDEGDIDPTIVTVEGNVRGVQDDSWLVAESLDARLERNAEGDLVVASALALGDCVFARERDQARAEADQVYAEPEKQLARLNGPRAMVSMRTARVYGEDIELDGAVNGLRVFGPGLFDDSEGSGAMATWTREMSFNDATGLLVGEGEVEATFEPDSWSRDRVSAHRLVARLAAPESGAIASADSGAISLTDGSERELQWAMLTGASLEDPEGSPARVQSTRLAPPEDEIQENNQAAAEVASADEDGTASASPDERPAPDVVEVAEESSGGPGPPPSGESGLADPQGSVEEGPEATTGVDASDAEPAPAPVERPIQALLLEGGFIEMDAAMGTLDVSTPGRLMHADLRDASTGSTGGSSQLGFSSGDSRRGESLLVWDGSMHMDQRAGRAVLDRNVRITHRTRDEQGEPLVTLLDADHVVAEFTESASGSDDGAGELRRALATGTVYVARKVGSLLTQEVRADRLDYDLQSQTADAWADPGNLVTYFDALRASSGSARRVFWDMRRGRLEVRSPGTVVGPR